MIDMFELAGADPQPGTDVNCGHRRQGNEINNFSPKVPRQINKKTVNLVLLQKETTIVCKST